MNKHTPGPWHLTYEKYSDHAIVTSQARIDNSKAQVAHVLFANPEAGMLEPFQSEQEANANLIAAAPDLLAALEQIIASECRLPAIGCAWKKATAAIARAKGESV